MPTFKHSGDLGDIIYALPTMKALGGGTLLLDIEGGRADPAVSTQCFTGHTKFNRAGYETIRPLLIEQPYITDVAIWGGETVDHNLDRFRRQVNADNRLNLAQCHLREFGLPEALIAEPWLTLRSPPLRLPKPVIINRSVRHHSKYHWWAINAPKLAPQAVFLGLEREHDIFQYTYNCTLDWHLAADALEIARILAASQILVGNQSFVMSIAAGLGTAFAQEVYDYAPNCVFQRPNAQYF